MSYINMNKILLLFTLLLPTTAPNDSYSLWAFATYIKGQTPFPEFGVTVLLDDVRVLYYNGDTNTYIGRGNTTNEDSVFLFNELTSTVHAIHDRWATVEYYHKPVGLSTLQILVLCQLDNGQPGHMFAWEGLQGSTIDDFQWYNGILKYTAQIPTSNNDITSKLFENLFYPWCIKLLKGYLEKRMNQVNRKVKPIVNFTLKPEATQLSCLATGFYPHDINMTLFNDGQPVDDRNVTGGDLLPNDDGTYQMRKILNISAEEKHIYNCSVTHVSLDNKLDVTLEYNNRKPMLVIILIPTVLGLVLISVIVAAIIQSKRRHAVTIAPVVLWRRPLAAPQRSVNSADSGVSNDSMIHD